MINLPLFCFIYHTMAFKASGNLLLRQQSSNLRSEVSSQATSSLRGHLRIDCHSIDTSTGWNWWSRTLVGLTWIFLFHHLALLPSNFSQIPTSPGTVGQIVEHSKSKSTPTLVWDHQCHPVESKIQCAELRYIEGEVNASFHVKTFPVCLPGQTSDKGEASWYQCFRASALALGH